VLTERWNQLLFGFQYPPEPTGARALAFVLLFVAIAPVLFFELPRKMLIFTGLYPSSPIG
jgi:general L-amino acid transport system permease protein